MADRPSNISNLLVFLPTWVGDAVMATPTLRALRRAHPDSRITLTGSPVALAVLADSPLADACLPGAGRDGLRGMLRSIAAYRRGRFDAAVLLANSFRVAAEAFLSAIPLRIGFSRDKRGWMLTERLAPPRRPDGGFAVVPALDYYLALAERLGGPTDDRRMELGIGESFAREATDLLAAAGVAEDAELAIINPGASFGSSKLWPAERFAAVADALAEQRGMRIVINAAPGEGAIAQAVADAMRGEPAVNFAKYKNSLGLLKALTARARIMITGDTGPRHIAAALGCPVVTIFGSTDPAWTVIDCPRERIIATDVPCAPCQKKTCPLPPGPEHHACMRSIPVERVLAAAADLLSAESPA